MESLTSFEIIENVSLPYVASLSAPNVTSQALLNGISENHSIPSNEFTTGGLYEQLQFLISENKALKEKLKRNNNIMLEELNSISIWQKQISETNHTHRAVLEESVQLNHKLQTEKQQLMKQLEECEATVTDLKLLNTQSQEVVSRCAELESQLKSLKDENDELRDQIKSCETDHTQRKLLEESVQVTQKLQTEKQELLNQLEACEATIVTLKLPCAQCQAAVSNIQKLNSELKAIKDENMKLSEKLKSRQAIHAELTKSIINSQDFNTNVDNIVDDNIVASVFNDDESGYAIVFQADEKKNEDVDDALRHEKQKSFALEDLLVEEKVISVSLTQLAEDNKKLLAFKDGEINELKSKLLPMENTLQEVHMKLESFKKSICDVCHTINSNLQLSTVQNASVENIDDQDLNSRMNKLVSNITNAFVALQKENEQNLANLKEKSDALENTKAELVNLQCNQEDVNEVAAAVEQQHIETVDVLTAKLLSVEEQLDVEIHRTSSLLEGSSQNESESFFKVQVETYRNDFEVEKQARISAQEEIGKLTITIKSLTDQLKEKEDSDNEKGRGSRRRSHHKHWSSGHSTSREQIEAEHSASAPPEPSMLICPKCQFGFYTLQALENHVDQCIQADSFGK